MKELDVPPLGGGGNTNIFVAYGGVQALLRSPHEKGINELFAWYYHGTGFLGRDRGNVTKRGPSEQYSFSKQAAEAGLAVLPPLALEGSKLLYPFLPGMQTLKDYLQTEHDEYKKTQLLFHVFMDIRNAHRQGFIYGDRYSNNILVDEKGFIHIDFDLAISGPYARDFEVAEASISMIHHGGAEIVPCLAATLGTLCAETPNWLNLDKTTAYIRRMGEMLYEVTEVDPAIFVNQEAMIAATYAVANRAAPASSAASGSY